MRIRDCATGAAEAADQRLLRSADEAPEPAGTRLGHLAGGPGAARRAPGGRLSGFPRPAGRVVLLHRAAGLL